MRILRHLVITALFAGTAYTQNSGALVPVPRQQPLGNGGQILAGSCMYTYQAGSTTPAYTYSNPDLAVGHRNENPLVLDSSGRMPAVYLDAISYKFVFAQRSMGACPGSPGTVIWSQDSVYDFGQLLKAALAATTGASLIGFEPTGGTVPMTVAGALNSFLLDAGYSSFAAACAAAGSTKTLAVTQSWAVPTGTYDCPKWFLASGVLVPAASAVVTTSPNFTCPTYQQCFNVSASGSRIAFTKSPSTINPNWYGADWTGTNDSTAPITAAYAAMQAGYSPIHPSTASTVLAFPEGVYKHTGLTFSNTMYVTGPHGSGSTATLLYTGAGTAITMGGQPSGNFSNLNILSASGSGSAAIGIDMRFATEFTLDHIQVGQGSTSGFATGIKVRASSLIHITNPTIEWCSTGILWDFDVAASAANSVEGGNFFAISGGAQEIRDVGSLLIQNNWCEAVQDCVLVSNANTLGNAAAVRLLNNSASLITGFPVGAPIITFTDPQFLHVLGSNASNALLVTGMEVAGNSVGGSPGNYCNTVNIATSYPGNLDNFFFHNNQWSGCTTAVINGDSRTYAKAQDETRSGGIVEFAGAMSGNDLEMNSSGALFTTQYLSGTYQTPYNIAGTLTPHSVTPAVSSCGTSPVIGVGSNDRAGEVVVGTGGGITSCTVTFGTSFSNQPYGPMTAIYIPPGATVTLLSQSIAGFTITGTAMAGVQVTWAFPFAN